MLQRPRSRAAVVVTIALATGLTSVLAPRAWAPDAHAQETEDAAREAARHARAVATWRHFVWSLDREVLPQVIEDAWTAREKAGSDGVAVFTLDFVAAFSLLTLGQEERGRTALESARATSPDFVGLILLDAFDDILKGERDAAIEKLDVYVAAVDAADPDDNFGEELVFLGHLHRGTNLHDAGRHDDAIADLEKALELTRAAGREPCKQLVQRLALAHQTVNHFDRAEELVTELLRVDPGDPYHYFNMGVLRGSQQDLVDARKWYEAAVARKHDYAAPRVKLAYIAWKDGRLGDMRQNLAAYKRLIGTDPSGGDLADLHVGLGLYWRDVAARLEDRGETERGLEMRQRSYDAFIEAVSMEPLCENALNNLVQAAYILGLPDEEFQDHLDRYQQILSGNEKRRKSTFC